MWWEGPPFWNYERKTGLSNYCIAQNLVDKNFGELVISKFWWGKLWQIWGRIIFCLLTRTVFAQWCTNSKSIIWKVTWSIMMYRFSVESVLWGYHEYKDNWPERSNFASASARGWRYFKIDIFAPKFAPQASTHAHANFLSRSQEFYKKMEINLVG